MRKYRRKIIMRKYRRKIIITTLLFFLFGIVTAPAPSALHDPKVKIPYGTSVNVQFSKVISPEEYNVGDSVNLVVVSDVKVEGYTVIKQGAMARAEVTVSKKRNFFGIPAEIGVRAKNVMAVDGTLVPIEFSKSLKGKDKYVLSIGGGSLLCFLLFLIKGEDVRIPAGTTEIATVVAPVEVSVE
jgi:hypothetical protein